MSWIQETRDAEHLAIKKQAEKLAKKYKLTYYYSESLNEYSFVWENKDTLHMRQYLSFTKAITLLNQIEAGEI